MMNDFSKEHLLKYGKWGSNYILDWISVQYVDMKGYKLYVSY
jgi:hypothetical protein